MTPSAAPTGLELAVDVPSALGDERARDDHELADEAVGAGQADARHRDDDEERRVDRHHLGEAAELVEQARVAAVVDHADQEEERAGRDAVVDHLQDRALACPPGSPAKRPSITKPEVATDE